MEGKAQTPTICRPFKGSGSPWEILGPARETFIYPQHIYTASGRPPKRLGGEGERVGWEEPN